MITKSIINEILRMAQFDPEDYESLLPLGPSYWEREMLRIISDICRSPTPDYQDHLIKVIRLCVLDGLSVVNKTNIRAMLRDARFAPRDHKILDSLGQIYWEREMFRILSEMCDESIVLDGLQYSQLIKIIRLCVLCIETDRRLWNR